jgi:hypothetical protein
MSAIRLRLRADEDRSRWSECRDETIGQERRAYREHQADDDCSSFHALSGRLRLSGTSG